MAIGQLTIQKLHFYTAHFDFTTAQIVINCTLKYALLWPINPVQNYYYRLYTRNTLMRTPQLFFVGSQSNKKVKPRIP